MLSAIVGLAIAELALAAPAWATLVLALDLPALVKRADQISVVDVVSVKAGWNEDHDRIVTTVDLAVVDCWKGSATPASHLQVVQPGGSADGLTMRVDGLPRFSPGERALVFLRFPRETPGRASVVGMAQGKRAVRRETPTGRWMVSAPERRGADYLQTTPASAAQFGAPPRPLGDLRSEVRSLVAGGGR
jgi:hypothetical protein